MCHIIKRKGARQSAHSFVANDFTDKRSVMQRSCGNWVPTGRSACMAVRQTVTLPAESLVYTKIVAKSMIFSH